MQYWFILVMAEFFIVTNSFKALLIDIKYQNVIDTLLMYVLFTITLRNIIYP